MEAKRFLKALEERLGKFHLKLHPDKTRLIEFGWFAVSNRRERGMGKPETFDFLGFTHICDVTRKGWFCVKRKTITKRVRAKLKALGLQLRRSMHHSIPDNGRWLASVQLGHYQYFGVPRNSRALSSFRHWVGRLWKRILHRCSGKSCMNWERMRRIIQKWLALPKIVHPYPSERLCVTT